ncbi:hypothetical protein AVEN_242430-1, partial [Araneus ventricosus]
VPGMTSSIPSAILIRAPNTIPRRFPSPVDGTKDFCRMGPKQGENVTVIRHPCDVGLACPPYAFISPRPFCVMNVIGLNTKSPITLQGTNKFV